MATKTETIPDDVRTYIHAITSALKRALETGDFTIEIAYDIITIKIPDIKMHIDHKGMRIMYKDLDIIYRDYVAKVQVFRTPHDYPDEYYAHEYWNTLYELHELALETVKDKIKSALIKL